MYKLTAEEIKEDSDITNLKLRVNKCFITDNRQDNDIRFLEEKIVGLEERLSKLENYDR